MNPRRSLSCYFVPGLFTPYDAIKRRPLLLVALCTLLGATAQVLIKWGAVSLGQNSTLLDTALGIVTSPTLFGGYALYGVFTLMLVVALRYGELSRLYPVIALTYVWVTVLSVVVFHETMNAFKIAGVLTIMTGVGVLGRGETT
jgi:drug/metabolite transporter (DMT)-like permease